jgi:hypothetical protein
MITFLSQPNTIEPVYGNLVFQFSSTAATDPTLYRYRYVVNVFTQDGEVAQLKITPSTEGWGQCDLSPILMNYTHSKPVNVGCSGATPLHQAAWGVLSDNMINYSIMVGEEYATTPDGVLTLYDGEGNVGVPVVRGNVCFAYNGVKEWFNGKNYNFNPFLLTGSTTFNSGVDRFMTNSPRSRWIRTGDYMTLAALNWFDVEGDVNSRQVYSALFKFYDEGNNLIQTSRTFNVESLCGTRPFCNYYDHFWTNPTNFAEEQVIYLGVGVPNITSHGIVFPDDVKYYSVELEATLNQPTPPDPEIDDFDGCSCYNYQLYNPSLESQIVIDYLDCLGVEQTITINPEATGSWCACQNTNTFVSSPTYSITGTGYCNACICKTYRVSNPDPDFPALFEYTSCSGSTETGSVPADDYVDVCACEGTIVALGLGVVLLGDCPLPFSADCHNFGVSTNVGYVLDITYTGCCGTEQTISIPPGVGVIVKANNPFPSSILWTAVDLGSTPVGVCPPIIPPTPPFTADTGTAIVGRNLCDNTLMYFLYSGETIAQGQYFNYDDVPYLFESLGGGGLVPLNVPYIFDSEEEVLSAFPCPTFAGDLCLDTTIISEPFFFYLDGECSPGDRLIYFMSKFGTWETYNFRAREDVGYSTNKEVLQTAPELYSQGWDTPSYNGWNSQRRVWYNKVAKSGVLYTDYMPQGEMLWLSEELFQSPSVYMVNDEGYLEPIVITNTEVVMPNYQINSNKYQISIEYKSSYDTIRQNQE